MDDSFHTRFYKVPWDDGICSLFYMVILHLYASSYEVGHLVVMTHTVMKLLWNMLYDEVFYHAASGCYIVHY